MPDPPGEATLRISSFPQFLRLPAELREMIWKHALPKARVLRASGTCCIEDWAVENLSDFAMPLAYVCSESRRVVEEAGYRLQYRNDDLEYGTGIWFCEGLDDYDFEGGFVLYD